MHIVASNSWTWTCQTCWSTTSLSHFSVHYCYICSPLPPLILDCPLDFSRTGVGFTFTHINPFLVRFTYFQLLDGVLLAPDSFTILLLLCPASLSPQFFSGPYLCPHPRHWHSSYPGVKLRIWAGNHVTGATTYLYLRSGWIARRESGSK